MRVPVPAAVADMNLVRTIGAAALAAVCGSLPLHAQSVSGGRFVADAQSGCKVWNPHPQSGETAVWSGACRDGFADGAGRLQWMRDGKPTERDDGDWRQGRQEGRGRQDWGSGRYDGDLVAGEPQGQGVLMLQSGRYEGGFAAGKPNGTGTMISIEGSFHGLWKDGCLVGDTRRIAIGVSSAQCR